VRRVLVPHAVSPPAAGGGTLHCLQGLTMGTRWTVTLVAQAKLPLQPLRENIQRCLDEVVAQMSTWESDSDLSRFNRAPAGSWHALPPDCFQVLEYALRVAQDSGGAYDPTAGALVNLWGFGPPRHYADQDFVTPQAAQLADARACAGWHRVALDPTTHRAQQPGGVYLDLSAVAKGFAVDQVARQLRDHGIESHLVEVGGELRGAGTKPDGQPWWVALENPSPEVATETIVALHGLAAATSGDYRRSFELAGKRHCHSIDPRTGHPIDHGLASVTVLHPQCMVADALSTALTVMGLEQGLAHARRHRLAALFVQRSGDALEEHMSDAFAALL
jgi:thiamine biosynthesis lipoprotein